MPKPVKPIQTHVYLMSKKQNINPDGKKLLLTISQSGKIEEFSSFKKDGIEEIKTDIAGVIEKNLEEIIKARICCR